MDARLQNRIQRYGWDKAAPYYERYREDQLAPARRRLLELAALQPGQHVLDIACGTGLVTFPAADAVGSSGSVTGVGISAAMVAHVTAEAARRRLPNIAAARTEAEALDFPDSRFDAVLCALGLMYVPDPRRALAEMRRVLQPGGRAVVAVWGAPQPARLGRDLSDCGSARRVRGLPDVLSARHWRDACGHDARGRIRRR